MGYLVVEHANRLSENYREIDDLAKHLREHYQLSDCGLSMRVFHDNQDNMHLLRGWNIELSEEQVLMLKIQYSLIVGYLE